MFAKLSLVNSLRNKISAERVLTESDVHEANSEILDLGYCNFGDAGVKNFCIILRENTTYRKLYLQNNNIGDFGASYLSHVLVHNRALTNLNLGSNEIGDAGAIVLSDALMQNNTLQSIDLHNNKIGVAGIMALTNSLTKNHTLCSLLYKNENQYHMVTKGMRDVLACYLERNAKIAVCHDYMSQIVNYREVNPSFCSKIDKLRNELKIHLLNLDASLFERSALIETYRLLKAIGHFHEQERVKLEICLSRPFTTPSLQILAEKFKYSLEQPVVPQLTQAPVRLPNIIRLEPVIEDAHKKTQIVPSTRQAGLWKKEPSKKEGKQPMPFVTGSTIKL